MSKKTITLISGGLDSAVTSFLAEKQSSELYGLTFLYGQRHQKEIIAAKTIGKHLNLSDHVFFSLDLSQFGGSSLYTSSTDPIPHPQSIDEVGTHIPSTYVPARNTVFLSIALSYAESIDADCIAIGVNAADYSGYPDCRPGFINAFQNMINVATKKTIEGEKIILFTPLLLLTKSEIIKKGHDIGVPFEHTWSCYQGQKNACGQCDSCLLRLKGFKEANLTDPLSYETTPSWYQQG
jgi:7-cyano-7-deazaguanine synthase